MKNVRRDNTKRQAQQYKTSGAIMQNVRRNNEKRQATEYRATGVQLGIGRGKGLCGGPSC